MQHAPDDEKELLRSRRTLFLLLGGALSLILPLMGILYLKLSDPTAARTAAPVAVVFDKRGFDGQPSSQQILPAATPAVSGGLPNAPAAGSDKPSVSPAVPPGSSLSFVRGGEDMYDQQPAAVPPPIYRPQPQAPPPPPPAAPPPAPAPARTFASPKLKSSGNFSKFSSGWQNKKTQSSNAPPSQAQAQQQEQQKRYGKSAQGAGSGSNLPKLGSFGSKKAPEAPAAPDMGNIPMGPNGQPDMGALMKNLPGASGSDRR